jgi:hypothetical protein
MTYPGYFAIGAMPLDESLPIASTSTEIVNSERAYAYAANAGICWLERCDECPPAGVIVPGGPDFVSPIIDPAPWYDVDNPDSWGFLGVVGLDIEGVESSTRQASVTMALTGGGVIGPTYLGPRTMVVRALAIATDECSLSFGLSWLRQQYHEGDDVCGGEPVTFFDCCPCVCDDDSSAGPCWPETYAELAAGPSCDPDYWPDTYDDLMEGPPVEDEEWCLWPVLYRQLVNPPSWLCCIDACVVPYVRQFNNARVTAGPEVLSHPKMNSLGAVAEIEFTVVAAEPEPIAMPSVVASALIGPGELYTDPAPPAPAVDRFARGGVATLPARTRTVTTPTQWRRSTVELVADPRGPILPAQRPRITLVTTQATGQVRLGLWRGDTRVAGYSVPYLPERSVVTISRRSIAVIEGEGERALPGFLRGWDAARWPDDATLELGAYTLTIDQEPAEARQLRVKVSMIPVGQ